jgi:hypothetical protein
MARNARKPADSNGSKNLDVFFTNLVAKKDSVPSDTVTSDYILKQRQKLIYPRATLDRGSDYGGYEGTGLKFRSQDEFNQLEKENSEWLSRHLAEKR